MQTSQGNMLLSLQNSERFLGDNAADIAGGVPPELTQMLVGSIAELSGHVSVQNGQTRAVKSSFAAQRTKREALLRDHMAPIAKMAKLLVSDTPELVSVTMPKGKPSAEVLAGLATGMAQHAAPYASVFTKAGMKPDFIQSLQAAATDLVSTLNDRTASKGKVKTATSSLTSKLSRGRKVVHAVDAFLRSALVGNPELLDAWNLVKRVPQPRNTPLPGAAKPATPAASPAAATPAAPTPAAGTPAEASPALASTAGPAVATPAVAAPAVATPAAPATSAESTPASAA